MADEVSKDKVSTSNVRSPRFVGLLRKFRNSTDTVTLIITSGQNCCEITGCVANIVENSYVVLLTNDNNGCNRTYVRIDCICAIQRPGINANDGPDVG